MDGGWGASSSGLGCTHRPSRYLQDAAWRPQGSDDRALAARARKAFERWGGGASQLNKQQAKLAFISLLGYRASKTELKRLCSPEGLSWEGFLQRVRERESEQDEEEEARQAFKALDRSCQGFLSLTDVKDAFHEAVPHIPTSVVEQVFFEMDDDRDGRLSYRRFREMWYFS